MSLRSEVIRIMNELLGNSKKITELPDATTPLGGTELFEIVQGGVNKKVAKSDVSTGGGGGSSTFVSLTDGPGSFSGKTLNFVRVNAGETALEYQAPSQVKTDIGLGDVDNTSDVNKPVSTAQAAADAVVLAAAESYADGLVVGLWDDRGNFDASVNAYPSSGGSGLAGAIKKGDIWTISVAGTLPTGQVVEIGDTVRAKQDTPGNTQGNWAIQQNNIGYVPLNAASNLSDLTNAGIARTNLGVAIGTDVEAHDADLTTIAGLTPTNDDIIQRKAGAWANRTIAQLKTDLSLSGTNTGDQTSVSGNAGTASALQTARTIDGQSFDGTANITVIAPGTHAATSKATPVDADELPLVDSAASNILKKLTWANLKATLKTYFDTLYQAVANAFSANTQTSDYTVVLGDAGKVMLMNKATAINLTIPPNSSVAFPVGTIIRASQVGNGLLTIVPGAAVTFESTSGTFTAPAKNLPIDIWQYAADTWKIWNGPPTGALTRVDDTNVTLTLGGSPSTALANATSITVGWSGQLSVARGGNGTNTIATGQIPYGSATDTYSMLSSGATGSFIRSAGVSTAPVYSTLILPNAATSGRLVFASATNTYGEDADLTFSGGDTLNTTKLIIGAGTSISKYISNTATLDFPSVASLGVQSLTITLTGAALGDVVIPGVPNGSMTAGLVFTAWVSATNTVTIQCYNSTLGAIDPASGTFKVAIFQ